jgi:hypothetical protein
METDSNLTHAFARLQAPQRDKVSFMADSQSINILIFADSVLGIHPYDWQCNILLSFEAGYQTAAACANFTGKTFTVFPIAALWTLYSYPRARLMYLSATSAQVKNQFFASLERFRYRPAFAGWTWLETEVETLTAVSSWAEPPTHPATSKAYMINPNLQPLSWLTKPNRSEMRSSMR